MMVEIKHGERTKWIRGRYMQDILTMKALSRDFGISSTVQKGIGGHALIEYFKRNGIVGQMMIQYPPDTESVTRNDI